MVLFVDDEKRVMDSYSLELVLCGYDVRFETKVDMALKFFEDNIRAIQLLVLDIMMPAGESLNNASPLSGLRTGVVFYKKIRAQVPELPVVILTNVTDASVEEFFINENHCWFLRKVDYLPFEFAAEIQRIAPLPAAQNERKKKEE